MLLINSRFRWTYILFNTWLDGVVILVLFVLFPCLVLSLLILCVIILTIGHSFFIELLSEVDLIEAVLKDFLLPVLTGMSAVIATKQFSLSLVVSVPLLNIHCCCRLLYFRRGMLLL